MGRGGTEGVGVRKWTRQGDSGDDSAAGRREKGVEKLA